MRGGQGTVWGRGTSGAGGEGALNGRRPRSGRVGFITDTGVEAVLRALAAVIARPPEAA